jgi:hypothetical protein
MDLLSESTVGAPKEQLVMARLPGRTASPIVPTCSAAENGMSPTVLVYCAKYSMNIRRPPPVTMAAHFA